MRNIVMVTLAAALACGVLCAGCDKPKGPQTTEAPPPSTPATALRPLEPGRTDAALEPAVTPVPEARPAPAPTALTDLAPTPAATPTPPGAKTYEVQKGDTLMKIAERFYGNKSRYRDILKANPSITDPNKLQVGQRLVIPK